MRVFLSAMLAIVWSVAPVQAQNLDRMERPPAGWTGKVFEPSYSFPQTEPPVSAKPWDLIDFRSDAAGYMRAVLAHVLEGQDRSTWRVQDNAVRKWYHAPWMGPGGNGREFINGLTRERSSRAGELGPGQSSCRQNWAVSFYNPEGGYALGRVWRPVVAGSGDPDLSTLPFHPGTVVAKLLFTEADETEVPILAGAPSVQANIHEDKNPADDQCPSATIGTPPAPAPRVVATLRLLQVDVAVREPRADPTTGWVFGTFVYNGAKPGADPWTKLDPVGLMWGNDPQLTDEDAASGKKPAQGVVLSDFGFDRHFGRGGRMNGPVDNPVSSCLSCHSTAQWPTPANMTPRGGTGWAIVGCWFRNLGPSAPFGNEPEPGKPCGSDAAKVTSLDFSLQLAVGRRNWEINKASGMFSATMQGKNLSATVPTSTFVFDELTLDVGGVRSLPVHR